MSAPMIGVFGGTFDPPHLGHLEAIQGVLQDPGFEHLWILPSGNPVGKSPTLSPSQRLELSRLAFEGVRHTEVLDTEVRWTESHPGESSTTWKILPELEKRAHGQPLCWIIGTDQLESLHRWDQFPEVLSRLHWLVLERKGSTREGGNLSHFQASGLIQPDPGVRSRSGRTGYRTRSGTSLLVVPTEARAVSSTAIREALARTGKPPEGLLLPAIEARLKVGGLYGSHST